MDSIKQYELQPLTAEEEKICLILLKIKQCENAATIKKLLDWFQRIENLETIESICYKVNMAIFSQYLHHNYLPMRTDLCASMLSIIKHMINCGGDLFIRQFIATDNAFIPVSVEILNDCSMLEFHTDIINIISRCVPYVAQSEIFEPLIEPLITQLYASNPLIKHVMHILIVLLHEKNPKYQILFAKYDGIPNLIEVIDSSEIVDCQTISIQIIQHLMRAPMQNARMAFNKRIFNTRILESFIRIITYQDMNMFELTVNLIDTFSSIPSNLEMIYRSELFHIMLPLLDKPDDSGIDRNMIEAMVHSLLQVTQIKEAAISLSNVGLPMKLIQMIEDFELYTSQTLEYVCAMIMNMCNYNECKKQFINFNLSNSLNKICEDETIDDFIKSDILQLKKRFDGMKMREEMFKSMQSVLKPNEKQLKKIQNAEQLIQKIKEGVDDDEYDDEDEVEDDLMDDLYAGLDDLDLGDGLTNISVDELQMKRDKEVQRIEEEKQRQIEKEEQRKRKEEEKLRMKQKLSLDKIKITPETSTPELNEMGNTSTPEIGDKVGSIQSTESKKDMMKMNVGKLSLTVQEDEKLRSDSFTLRSSPRTPRNQSVQKFIQSQKQRDPKTQFNVSTHNPNVNRHAFLSHQRTQEGNLKKSLRKTNKGTQNSENIIELLDVPTMNELADQQNGGFSLDDAKVIADLNVKKVTRRHIVQEMYHTEKTYTESLIKVCTLIMPEMKKVMKTDEYRKLFNNIEEVCKVHKEFFSQIETLWNNNQDKPLICVADIFIELFTDKKMYDTYMYYYTHADSGLHFNYSQTSPDAQRLALQFKQQRLPIESFLIQPIQRLPRYILLLKELIKSTPEIAKPEYQKLIDARDLCDKITCEFNAQTKIIRDKQRLDMYAQKIQNYVPQANRTFIRDGEIVVKTKKRKMICTVCLMSDVCFLLQKKKDEYIIVQELYFKTVTGVFLKDAKKKTSLEKILNVSYKEKENLNNIEFIMGVEIPHQEWHDDFKKCFALFNQK